MFTYFFVIPLKASSLSADRSDFRISRKLVWAPPRHHRILNLVTTYHNNGWRKILSQCSAIFQRFKIALPNCVQLAFSWESVFVQLGFSLRSVGNQLGFSWRSVGNQFAFSWQTQTDIQLIVNWLQLNANWIPTDCNWTETDSQLNRNWTETERKLNKNWTQTDSNWTQTERPNLWF